LYVAGYIELPAHLVELKRELVERFWRYRFVMHRTVNILVPVTALDAGNLVNLRVSLIKPVAARGGTTSMDCAEAV